MKKWVKIAVISVSSVVVVSLAAFFIYVSIYYHATDKALAAMQSDNTVTVTESGGRIVLNRKPPNTASSSIRAERSRQRLTHLLCISLQKTMCCA